MRRRETEKKEDNQTGIGEKKEMNEREREEGREVLKTGKRQRMEEERRG